MYRKYTPRARGGRLQEETNMNQPKNVEWKAEFEEPAMEILHFSCDDIVTVSTVIDENEGEWDPQEVDDLELK